MNIPLGLRLALRFLFSRGTSSFSSYASWLAIGGLSIGVTSLMLTASIIQGFENTISEKLSNFDGQGRLGNIFGKSFYVSDPSIKSIIKDTPGEFHPFVKDMALIRFGSKADGVIIEGVEVPPQIISKISTTKINDGNIIIGKGLASYLGVNVNDKIYLQGLATGGPLSNIPRIKPFTVSFIYYSGLQEYDKSLAYVSINDSRSLFSLDENEVSGLILNSILPSKFKLDVQYPYYFETWKDKHSLLFEWISVQRWPAYIMFGLIALVGIVNLIAAITMIIIEKTNQVGILLAQGAHKSMLRNIFILLGGFIGLIGGLIGGCISIVFILIQLNYNILEIPADIYFMDQIPFSFDYGMFLLILLLSFLLSLVASLLPLRVLSSLKPAIALRYE